MNQNRKSRSVQATLEGQQKLKESKAKKRNQKDKPWTYPNIVEVTGLDEKTIKSFFYGKPVDEKTAMAIVQALDLKLSDIIDLDDPSLLPKTEVQETQGINWLTVCHTKLEDQEEQQRIRRKASEMGFELNVHVPLGLVEREKQQRRDENVDRGQIYQLEKEVIAKIYEHKDFLKQVINRNQAGKNKHIAIVGEPGAGKTTLLSAIATYIKEENKELPIFISLGSLEGMTLEKYLLKKWLPDAMRLVNPDFIPTPEIEEQLKSQFYKGGVWLLLDGVDEMGESSPIQALRKISQALTDWLGKARVVLTCRLNVWDASLTNNELSGFDTYKTQEFKPEEVDKFIEDWFKCGDKIQRGEELKAKLRETGKERIRELVTNPLRLSLLCQIFYQNQHGELPETKAGLFDLYTEYFYDWKPEIVTQNLNYSLKQELHNALGRLALAGINSDARFRLNESLAVTEMGQSLFDLASRQLGWLNLVDRDASSDEAVYAFFHPNFQEYFAALVIDDWHYFLNHVPNNPDKGTYRIFESHWKEVILLWFGREEKDDFKRQQINFIALLLLFDDSCIKLYNYRALFLAALGINELIAINRFKKNINLSVIFIIALQLVFDIAFYKWPDPYFESIAEYARDVILELDRNFTIKFLVEVIDNCEEMIVEVIEILGKIGNGSQIAIDALCDVINYGYGEAEFAAIDLQSIAIGNQKAIDILVEIMLTSKESNRKNLAAQVLQSIAIGNQKAINKIEEAIHRTKDIKLLWIYYYTLAKIAPFQKQVLNEIARILLDIQKQDLLDEYCEDIMKLNNDQQKIIENLTGYNFAEIQNYKNTNMMTKEEFMDAIEKINKASSETDDPLNTRFKNYKTSFIVKAFKPILLELEESEERKIEYVSRVLWQCAQNMSYPEFYRAWHGESSTIENLENQFTDTHSLLTQLQPTNKIYPLPLNLKTLEGETKNSAISQEICNQIYFTAFNESEEIPEVNNAPQLKRIIPQVKKHLQTENLALIINNCEPNEAMIKFCHKLTDVLHIAFITEQPLDAPLKGFQRNQPNLFSAIQIWISEIG